MDCNITHCMFSLNFLYSHYFRCNVKTTTVTAISIFLDIQNIFGIKIWLCLLLIIDFFLNDTNHVDKDMLLTQHLVCICISDDHENVLMIRMVTRKTNTYMGYPFKNLKSLSFHFLNQIKCNWFYNLKRLKSKSLSICY